MSTNTAFRLSTYLTLALACIALGHAIFPIFPEAGLFAGASVIALAVIYRLEVRVRLLSLSDANMLGGGIALCVAMWATYRIVHELRTGRSADLGWTLFGVALMGPLLMAAIPAKLLRREKHAGDYWQLHAAGLGAIVLAGAVDETPFTVIIMAAYTACAIWSLAQFQLARADGTVPPVPEALSADENKSLRPPPLRVLAAGAGRSAGIVRAFLLMIAAAIIAIPLYLLMPRSSFGKQEFGKPRIEIGYAADQMIDLNRSGKLETNREVAFTVEAREQNKAKTDLSPEQRWRGRVLTQYRSGTWQRDNPIPLPAMAQTAMPPPRFWSPPDLGPGQFELRFTVPEELGANFLADPVIWKPGEAVPIADALPGGAYRPWHVLPDGSMIRALSRRTQEPNLPYIQVYRPLKDPGLGPPFRRASELHREFLDNPVRAVKEYADKVLDHLVEKKVLPPAVLEREPSGFHIPPEYHEAVARAFEDYLSHHAGLSYTTELRRVKRNVDPVEDFLLHSRTGHCERFASALVLMLRSEGIPAVAVLGFKGCEHTGDGRYEVRHEHAHVWAEALISRSDNAGDGRVWHWLSLDPSPDEEVREAASGKAGGLLARASGWGRDTLDRYLIRYSPEEQRRALSTVTEFLSTGRFLSAAGILAAGVLATLAVRRYRHPRKARSAKESAWLDPLVGVLAAAGYHAAAGQTPREFATAVADELEQHPATQPVASVPGEWVEAYYRTRFGGVPTSDFVQSRLDLRLEELRAALSETNR